MSDKEKWLDGELWNFVRGAAIDLEIPLKSPAEEQLYWHMKQACGVYANVLAVECRAPAPQLPNGENLAGFSVRDDEGDFICSLQSFMEDWVRRYGGAATPQVTPTLKEILKQYGAHHIRDCDALNKWKELPCNCGFAALIEGTSEQASPTPDKCPKCGSGIRSVFGRDWPEP